MRQPLFHNAAAALAILFALGAGSSANAQTTDIPAAFKSGTKEVLIPSSGITRVPASNDFNNPESEYSFKHAKATDNFVLFWAREYGDDPMANPNVGRRFDVDGILKEADRFYDFYVNTMKWVDKDKSYATKYKFLFFVIPSPNNGAGTAFGGSVANKIGAFWSPATRILKGPYGVVAHELGHSFQALVGADGAARFSGGNFGEMTSQWMLWQVYPEWLTFENYHLVAYLKATHLAFLHPDNQYHTAGVPEYWSEKHGVELIGKMWREVRSGEDPVSTYKRLTGITQAQLNDEMFDADRRFVTWDMPRIEKVAAPYRNLGGTSINKAAEAGWYQIAVSNCPQNYGYNAIQLKVPAARTNVLLVQSPKARSVNLNVPNAGTKVSLDFKGMAGADGFSNVQVEKAGWRYGFLAYKDDNTRVYSDTFSKSPGTAEFTVPANTKNLWLVVMGAPTEHWVRAGGRGGGGGGRGRRGGAATNATTNVTATVPATTNAAVPATTNEVVAAAARGGAGGNPNAYEQWPYTFKLTGTSPEDSSVH